MIRQTRLRVIERLYAGGGVGFEDENDPVRWLLRHALVERVSTTPSSKIDDLPPIAYVRLTRKGWEALHAGLAQRGEHHSNVCRLVGCEYFRK